MRSRFIFIFTTLIIVGFATFMITYTVRFTESAVVTTFGQAAEQNVVTEPGVNLRWPYPVQRVTKYDTRSRFLQTRGETHQTADDRQIIVEAFLTWRVSDPLKFYRRFSNAGVGARDHYRAARNALEPLLRSAMSEVSRYRLDELFTDSEEGSKLGELEQRIERELVRAEADEEVSRLSDYGVELTTLGINRIVLPEETTGEVFARMKATRERLAAEARSRGEIEAKTIKDNAESAAARIRAFAENRAEQIRVQGDTEASQWYEVLGQEPELAVFLEELEFMKRLYGRRATLLLPAEGPGLGLFDPQALKKQAQGQEQVEQADAGDQAPSAEDQIQ